MKWLIDIVFALVMSRMAGLIVIWSGAVDAIPAGWVLCDGNNGTPNLRYKFVIGGSAGFPPGTEGGELLHTHELTMTAHEHDFTSWAHTHAHAGALFMAMAAVLPYYHSSEITTGTTDPETTEGENAETSHLPPYYSLCYIMKV